MKMLAGPSLKYYQIKQMSYAMYNRKPSEERCTIMCMHLNKPLKFILETCETTAKHSKNQEHLKTKGKMVFVQTFEVLGQQFKCSNVTCNVINPLGVLKKAVARVLVPATIILKFAVLIVFKIRTSKVYR